jgi:phage gp29-like protein
MGRTPSFAKEVVTWDVSVEWGNIFGYLPDPDEVLRRTGQDVTVFDSLLTDPHVFACYQSRKAGVLNSERRVDYPKGSEKMTEYCDRMMEFLPVENIIAQVLDAPFYGFSVSEIVWKMTDGKWFPVAIEQKPNDWFVWDYEGNLRFLSRRNMIQGELLPPYKFMVARHFATYKNPYGIRTLSRCFWPVSFKKGSQKYWIQFIQKFGIPWLHGKVPRGTSEELRQLFVDKLSDMSQSAVVVTNDDESVATIDVSGRTSGSRENVFEQKVNVCNSEISKAILTQTLTTEIGDKGAYAATQSHLRVRNELCQMDKKLVCDTFAQLFDYCRLINFAGVKVSPKLSFIEEDDPKEEHARRDTQLSSQGVRFKPDYYARVYNLRPGEFEVTDPKPAGKPQDDSAKQAKRKAERTENRENPKKSTEGK